MRETITVLELISRIRKTRQEMDSMYNIYINPDTRSDSRAMVSLYNESTKYTVNGKKIEEVEDEIISIDNDINNTFKKLQKLLMIKEQINATCKLIVPSPFDNETIELSIAQILVLKSTNVAKYNTEYLDKLDEDYRYGSKILSENQRSALSSDKIDKYVNAKMNSLNIASGSEVAKDTYSKFAEEYRSANRLEILDPLKIGSTIKSRKKNMSDFYETINIKLMEFNATKKLWVDLSSDNEFWGLLD